MNNIRRRIAIRKFVAIPLTILSGTAGSFLSANFALAELLDDESDTYVFSIILGLLLSSILAVSLKGLLKLYGKFKFDYIFFALIVTTFVVSSLSFFIHVFFVILAY